MTHPQQSRPETVGGANRLLRSIGAITAIPPTILSLVKLRQGDVLFEKGQELDRVYFPHTLVASMLVVTANGDSVDVGTVGCEGLLDPFLLKPGQGSTTKQIVQVAGTATVVDRDNWLELVSSEPEVHAIVGAYCTAFMTQVLQSAACNALHTSEERFARWLLMMDDRAPGGEIALTHEVIGKMLGVRRPTVTLTAGMFQRSGFIASSRGRLQIASRAGLEAIACECYGIVKAAHDALLEWKGGGAAATPQGEREP